MVEEAQFIIEGEGNLVYEDSLTELLMWLSEKMKSIPDHKFTWSVEGTSIGPDRGDRAKLPVYFRESIDKEAVVINDGDTFTWQDGDLIHNGA